MGNETLETLLRQLGSPEWEQRVDAVNQLAKVDDDRTRAALVRALFDPDDNAVTEAAAYVMVMSGDMRYVEPLLYAMEEGTEAHADDIWSVVHGASDSPVADEVFRLSESP